MKEKRNVETVEDFKLRIAAVRHISLELIPPPRRMNVVLGAASEAAKTSSAPLSINARLFTQKTVGSRDRCTSRVCSGRVGGVAQR